jgi:hypothetical protein
MKKINAYIWCFIVLMQFFSCDNVTDVEPKGLVSESNYYQTPEQVESALIGAYNPVGWQSGTTQSSGATWFNVLAPLNAASDECFAGGGGPTDFIEIQLWNDYNLSAAQGPQSAYWDRSYAGINRVNLLLSKINEVEGLSDSKKKRFIAEAKFLRGYYYFWLIRLFKNIPLITTPLNQQEIYQQEQVPTDSIYKQIKNDFNSAITGLPPAPLDVNEKGRATKGAAQAFLAKTIMWEVGTDNDMNKIQQAANLLEQVNTSPAYDLLNDYADIFETDNKFNRESIFEINHSAQKQATWGDAFTSGNIRGNIYTQMVGPRSYDGPKYESGWSFTPITPLFADSMRGDPRYQYTIADIDSIVGADPDRSYQKGYQNTGYFVKKFAPLKKNRPTGGATPLNWPNNYIEIRLADTYLLQAEALVRLGNQAKAAFYLNKVRARVDLPPVTATLKNIYHERYMELGTEGHRWFNLVRTGRASDVLGPLGYKEGINEVLPIPLESLNNTMLEQNPGY